MSPVIIVGGDLSYAFFRMQDERTKVTSSRQPASTADRSLIICHGAPARVPHASFGHYHEDVQVLVPIAGAVVLLLVALVLARRERIRRTRLDRQGLDHLRRIYRRDNPRGPGLEPLMKDQQPRIRPQI